MEAGAQVLMMHLCKDPVPEDQKFLLREVSERSALPCSVWGRQEAWTLELSLA